MPAAAFDRESVPAPIATPDLMGHAAAEQTLLKAATLFTGIRQLEPGHYLIVERSGAARDVGAALGRNPFPIVVPCHRVVGANSIGGFSAAGGSLTKLKILEIEAAHSQSPVQGALPF